MSNARGGYNDDRRALRRRKYRGRRLWYVSLTAGAFLVAAGLLVAQHQSRRAVPLAPKTGADSSPLGRSLTEVALVVFNSSDPLSRELATYYAEKRGIPDAQVVGLRCPLDEEISREDYDKTIAEPLRAIFDQKGWWRRTRLTSTLEPDGSVTENRIRFIALIRGMPLKIRAAPGYPVDAGNTQPDPIRQQSGACVDSELAALGFFTRAISGVIVNPYFRSYNRIIESAYPRLMLVTRLDAPTPSMVRRMIDDSLAAEKVGLWGRCYLDGRGFAPGSNPLAEGDVWLSTVFKETAPFILPTIMDKRPDMFTREYPMTETALYLGWYSENVAGPFTRPEFRFERGAVACHLHSFSAVSVRDPARHWVGPLLERGAAATLGNVYEPYLTLTVHMDILAARLFDGYTLAESAYAATPGLSWMDVVIGDPLYRPGKVLQELSSDLSAPAAASTLESDPERAKIITEGRAYWRGAQLWHARGAGDGGKALEKSGRELRSGRICEGLGLLRAGAGDTRGAVTAFQQAQEYYKSPPDDARVVLDEAQALADGGQKPAAVELLRKNRPRFANQVVGAALDQLEAALGATP